MIKIQLPKNRKKWQIKKHRVYLNKHGVLKRGGKLIYILKLPLALCSLFS